MVSEHNSLPQDSANGSPAPGSEEQKASVQQRIDQAIHEAARKLEQTAEQFERIGSQGSRASEYSQKVASQLRSGARLLEGTQTESLLDETRTLVRRHPMASLGVAFGVGFVVARLLRR
ncbi:DUF883 family protein [Gloeobacter kilaueensis]|uniref:DUF883 domain-containing protein n=1 Tax=Gloeobacter kilaueensis (strain ATCC BAA-2537 / CCAP 1431/1 / ULC 316 / JS1) TaxID=1183438 RepID=U5QCE6_GLOK1|nr:DUF883 C-terminal domain-containing protein [Gloeobacter kilaueensis]AGY56503.1 hypothetical protein GKIL_0256 [Gloeobacter kilaueensis JS1]